MTQTNPSQSYFAAVDLGSNSFHLLIARLNDGLMEKVDREKEMVQLARGLQHDGSLSEEVREGALQCLQRFGERLRDIPSEQVRVVGTKTLRDADAAGDFLVYAEQALGHPIAIISGYEEARLVYAGLSHSMSHDDKQRLVIDIGGASTEFIIGCNDSPELLESLDFGCVAITRQFLSEGIDRDNIHHAYLFVCEQIEAIRAIFVQHGWDRLYGTSGTMRAIAELTTAQDGGALISAKALDELFLRIHEAEGIFEGGISKQFSKQRRAVLPAGIIILKAIFDGLNLDAIHVADATLKEGLIFDTVGRLSHDDIRHRAISKLQHQYQIDIAQAERVNHIALHLLRQVETPALAGISRTKLLSWAAQLHEIGLGISHSGHHHHGLYILKHSDLAGFSRYEQQLLAHMVGCQRKKVANKLYDLDAKTTKTLTPLLICLRLSIILNRGRDGIDTHVSIHMTDSETELTFSDNWLEQQPMTFAGLAQEAKYLSAIGINLSYQ